MVIYFTGTGNSRFLARSLAAALEDELVSAPEMIKQNKTGDFKSQKPWVFVCPTYGWQMPRIFRRFIESSRFTGSSEAYFVMDCGSETGNAQKGIKELCAAKGFKFRGVAEIQMPENYIALFTAPDEKTAEKLVRIGERKALKAAELIKAGKDFPEKKPGVLDRLYSGPVNWGFYRFAIGDKKFHVTDSCVSCGQCAENCMVNNISMENGRPVWQGKCIHCMECINRCPAEAIEYGRHSVGLRRYYLD